VSAGGFKPGPVAPGSIVSLFGSELAPGTTQALAPWPKILRGVSVFVNGMVAPLAYVSPTQINAQIPYETAIGSATVNVVAGEHVLPPIALTVQPIAPSLFVDVQNHVIAQNQDGTANGTNHPAAPGTLLTAYLTGQGALNGQIADGTAAPAQSSPLNSDAITPQARVTAVMGKRNAQVVSARMAPGLVGVLEVVMDVPALTPGAYSLTVDIGGVASNTGVVNLGAN
jgi:uncharacterized protein (TIGR03437 family)